MSTHAIPTMQRDGATRNEPAPRCRCDPLPLARTGAHAIPERGALPTPGAAAVGVHCFSLAHTALSSHEPSAQSSGDPHEAREPAEGGVRPALDPA
jgi:hypothetical protein